MNDIMNGRVDPPQPPWMTRDPLTARPLFPAPSEQDPFSQSLELDVLLAFASAHLVAVTSVEPIAHALRRDANSLASRSRQTEALRHARLSWFQAMEAEYFERDEMNAAAMAEALGPAGPMLNDSARDAVQGLDEALDNLRERRELFRSRLEQLWGQQLLPDVSAAHNGNITLKDESLAGYGLAASAAP